MAAKEAGSVKEINLCFLFGGPANEKIFPSNPDVMIYVTANCMQMWVDLHKEGDKSKLIRMVCCQNKWMGGKQVFDGPSSDIAVT